MVKVRIKLINKITGEIVNIQSPLFSELNGLMNFPVDLNEWKVLRIDRNTEVKDIDKKEIYENDFVEFYDNGKYVKEQITYNDGMFQVGNHGIYKELVRQFKIQICKEK